MVYTPYDFNEAVRHRAEYVEERLRSGSPVVGLSCRDGALLLSVRRSQRKIYEIYDRLMFSAIGHQGDIETFRIAAIDFCHQEGYQRSPDDVSAQRLVGFALSPPLKRAFGDTFTAPFVLRGIFAELGKTPEADAYYVLNYDGEFSVTYGYGAIAGSRYGEELMRTRLAALDGGSLTLQAALAQALRIWALGSRDEPEARGEDDEDGGRLLEGEEEFIDRTLREALAEGTVEAGILQRNTQRESKFRLLGVRELEPLLAPYRLPQR
jgi:proteasome alpha subunit